MFGRMLKIGCLVVVGSIFMTGCLLSSSIEQRVASNYQEMSANVQAQSAAEHPDPAKQLALIEGIIEANKQEANRYNMLLMGVVIVVLGSSALVVATITLFFLTRYLRPIEDKYEKALVESHLWRTNGRPPTPFSNTTNNHSINTDVTIPHRFNLTQSDNRNQPQPHCERLTKRYKVDDKWTQ